MSTIYMAFGNPGDWADFRMRATWSDVGGYRHTDWHGPADIPAEHAGAMQGVVAAIVGLAEPWQAQQVWARRATEWVEADPESTTQFEPYAVDYVELEVQARHTATGGTRRFCAADYPEFKLYSHEVLAFFDYFTNTNTTKQ